MTDATDNLPAIEINDETFVLPPAGRPGRGAYMIQQELRITDAQRVYVTPGADVDALIHALGGVPRDAVLEWAHIVMAMMEEDGESTELLQNLPDVLGDPVHLQYLIEERARRLAREAARKAAQS